MDVGTYSVHIYHNLHTVVLYAHDLYCMVVCSWPIHSPAPIIIIYPTVCVYVSLSADISKNLESKRKRLETFTQSSVKASSKRVDDIWKKQQQERYMAARAHTHTSMHTVRSTHTHTHTHTHTDALTH